MIKRRLSKTVIIIFTVITFNSTNVFAEKNDGAIAIDLLQQYHYSGLKIDNKIIDDVKHDFLENLDKNGFFFLKTDIDELLSIPVDTDDFSSFKQNAFYKKSVQLYKSRLTETIQIVSDICSKSLDYYTDETITVFKKNSADYPADQNNKKLLWNKIIKLEILSRVYNLYIDSKTTESMKSFLEKNETQVKTEVEKIEKHRIENILNYSEGFDRYMRQIYLNTIVTRFDPHSMILSSKQINRLISELSSQSDSFGITLNIDYYNNIIIEQIIPGGSAWKSGSINKGDILLSVQVPGEPETDLSGYNISEAYDCINGKSNIITLKIRKKNSLIITCKLLREKISSSNSIMTSYVLDGNKKFGYICLPAFYTDWNTPGQLGCSNDVAKEIIKLQRDKIEGLILDLRDNSGGSIAEAISLAGLFIDEGAMAVAFSKNGEYIVYKDPSRGTIYDGPLIVMVNRQSASASEMVASILKDYNRAVIVGGQTFGKGSAQDMIPVLKDAGKYSESALKRAGDNDYLNYTISIIYNSTGESYQKTGVIPHVVIPEITDINSIKEEKLKYCIAPGKSLKTIMIDRNPYIKSSLLAGKSRARVSSSNRFKAVSYINAGISRLSSTPSVFLNADKFIRDSQARFASVEKANKNIFMKSNVFSARLNSQDKDILLLNSFIKEISKENIKHIEEDVCIDEVYKIALDYINIK